MSGSLGGGKSKSSSSSEGFQQSEQMGLSAARSGQTIAFNPFFENLYGQASNAAGKAIDSNVLGTAARQLFTGGSKFLAGLNEDAGSEYLEGRLSGDNPVLEQQIDRLREDTGRLFREEFNPAITSETVAGGTYGGSRQGVAQGLAMKEAGELFTRGAIDLRGRDIGARDSAAQSIAQNTLQAANTGLGSLPMLLSLLDQGQNSELGILQRLSSIMGGPQTLSESESYSESLGRSYGEQSSRGKSSSFNFNTSFGAL